MSCMPVLTGMGLNSVVQVCINWVGLYSALCGFLGSYGPV